MNRSNSLIALAAILAIGVAGGFWVLTSQTPDTAIAKPATTDLVAGKVIYDKTCATCHGAKLQGQENWQVQNEAGGYPAPPHDQSGHTWHHSDKILFTYTKLGGAGALAAQGVDSFPSGMPAFGGALSDADIWNVLGYIMSTWPERTQKIRQDRMDRQ